MVDQVDCLALDGGPKGLGFISGSADVDPSSWFFKAHFYQDPVIPGSLGLESFVQLIQLFALRCWPDIKPEDCEILSPALDTEHSWLYRGQVIPKTVEFT